MRFLKLKEVMQKTALSRSTIYRKMNNDEFPKSICLGDRAVAWLESEVDEWMGTVLQNRNIDLS
ncbi:AlpA family transcriptional regulator [Motilimonas pumila]|uniref:AlpA family transcriptional regulator n=1 Tax=Motilimonas pumila TaxID=2303987 RepID=A0A418YAS0_9GAMM|nr:AlpA family transcriptional regulator [Motilimonas pumila]RJG40064.1 AlpA family transcriptional regulator [Motilimonas pumila]